MGWWWIAAVLFFLKVIAAAEVHICGDSLAARTSIIHGSFTGIPRVVSKLYDIRSKVECAIICESELHCNTAVYQDDGTCLLLRNSTSQMNISLFSSDFSHDIMPVRQARNTSIGNLCPSTCVAPAICVYDCTNSLTPTPICVDVSKSTFVSGCKFNPIIQSREYYLNNFNRESSADGYTFFAVVFPKVLSSSMLRIMFRGVLRSAWGAGCGGNMVRWRFLFNGSHCSDPGLIESVQHNHEADSNHHKSTGILGICNNLAAGNVTISFVGYMSCTYSRVGFASYGTRLFVEELNQAPLTAEPPVNACPSLPVFNTRQYTTTSEWGDDPTTTLWNIQYTKMEASTGLRINLDFIIRLHCSDGQPHCVTWYIRIDGADCSPNPIWKTLAHLENPTGLYNEHRSVEIEGHCYGISAGAHTLSLIVGTCPWGVSSYDAYTGGWSMSQRWTVDEFRTGTNVAAVMSSDGTIYRIPQFNVQTAAINHLASGADNDVVWNLPNFNKIYAASGLRLTMSSDGRCYYISGMSPCCRHYFKINGVECTNPGTIEGIHYLSKLNTNVHRPITIDGICEGIPSGTVTISVFAGICKDHTTAGDCYFGWNSVVHVMMSETFVDREITNY